MYFEHKCSSRSHLIIIQTWSDTVYFIYPEKTAQTFLPWKSLCLRLVPRGVLDYCHPCPLTGISHKECQVFYGFRPEISTHLQPQLAKVTKYSHYLFISIDHLVPLPKSRTLLWEHLSLSNLFSVIGLSMQVENYSWLYSNNIDLNILKASK